MSSGGRAVTHRSQGPAPSGGPEYVLWEEQGSANQILRNHLLHPHIGTQGKLCGGAPAPGLPTRPELNSLPVVLRSPSNSPTATEYPENSSVAFKARRKTSVRKGGS